jgi:hypothetical protein
MRHPDEKEVEKRFERAFEEVVAATNVVTRALRALSDSRHLSRGFGDAGLRHFLLDAQERRFVRFVPGFLYGSHAYLQISSGAYRERRKEWHMMARNAGTSIDPGFPSLIL